MTTPGRFTAGEGWPMDTTDSPKHPPAPTRGVSAARANKKNHCVLACWVICPQGSRFHKAQRVTRGGESATVCLEHTDASDAWEGTHPRPCRPFAIVYATKFELSRGCVEWKDRHSDGLQHSELGGVNAAEAVLSLGGGEGRVTARKGSAQGFIFKFFLNSSIKRNHPCVDR